MNVIYHINEPEKWEFVISNVKTMLMYGKEHHETFHMEIVANADAVNCLCRRNDEYQAAMEKLSEDGILIMACHNSLIKRGINSNELYSFVDVVASGVVELTKKQTEGFAYIKV